MTFDLVVTIYTLMRGAIQKEMFESSDLRRREILHIRSVCPPKRGVGYSDISIHT